MTEWAWTPTLTAWTVALLSVSFLIISRWVFWPDVMTKMEARIDRHREEIDELREGRKADLAEIDALRAAMNEDREEMAILRAEMEEWQRGMKRVFEQMQAAGLVPVWTPRAREYRPPTKRPNATLANRIAEQFNIDEINGLAYDIGILPDEFPGETKEQRARELVELSSRRGIGPALVGRVNELRSNRK